MANRIPNTQKIVEAWRSGRAPNDRVRPLRYEAGHAHAHAAAWTDGLRIYSYGTVLVERCGARAPGDATNALLYNATRYSMHTGAVQWELERLLRDDKPRYVYDVPEGALDLTYRWLVQRENVAAGEYHFGAFDTPPRMRRRATRYARSTRPDFASAYWSNEHRIQFGDYTPGGTLVNVRMIRQSAIQACPHYILVPEHYAADGTCRCTDPTHAEMAEWGYTFDGTRWVAEDSTND